MFSLPQLPFSVPWFLRQIIISPNRFDPLSSFHPLWRITLQLKLSENHLNRALDLVPFNYSVLSFFSIPLCSLLRCYWRSSSCFHVWCSGHQTLLLCFAQACKSTFVTRILKPSLSTVTWLLISPLTTSNDQTYGTFYTILSDVLFYYLPFSSSSLRSYLVRFATEVFQKTSSKACCWEKLLFSGNHSKLKVKNWYLDSTEASLEGGNLKPF